jgi:hypothetical protein
LGTVTLGDVDDPLAAAWISIPWYMSPVQPTATIEYSELAPNVTVIVLEVVSAPVLPVEMNTNM